MVTNDRQYDAYRDHRPASPDVAGNGPDDAGVDSVSDCDYSFVIVYPQPSLARQVIWCLLGVWLLLGGVAFVEQISSVPETSNQDEQALSELGLTLKPEVGTLTPQVSSSATTTVVAPLIVRPMFLPNCSTIPGQDSALRYHKVCLSTAFDFFFS